MALLALLLAPALAGNLAWKWTPGQALRFHAETLLTTPGTPDFLAVQNEDARVTRVQVVLDLSCVATARSKGWNLACDVETARLAGEAVRGEQEKLDRILASYGTLLEACTIQMMQLPDGRITDLDLEGYANSEERSSTILDTLRQLARRTVAPLDLQLPKNGDDPGKAWKQTGVPLVAEAFGASGVTGGLDLKNQLTATDAAGATVETVGSGNLNIARPGWDLGDLVHVDVTGKARFDTAAGDLAYRTTSMSMETMGAAIQASGWGGYRQVGWIARWDANGVIEGPDGPIAPTAPTGP